MAAPDINRAWFAMHSPADAADGLVTLGAFVDERHPAGTVHPYPHSVEEFLRDPAADAFAFGRRNSGHLRLTGLQVDPRGGEPSPGRRTSALVRPILAGRSVTSSSVTSGLYWRPGHGSRSHARGGAWVRGEPRRPGRCHPLVPGQRPNPPGLRLAELAPTTHRDGAHRGCGPYPGHSWLAEPHRRGAAHRPG